MQGRHRRGLFAFLSDRLAQPVIEVSDECRSMGVLLGAKELTNSVRQIRPHPQDTEPMAVCKFEAGELRA